MHDFGKLFEPRGIAIVGASNDPTRTGGQTLLALNQYGYAGGVFPINPKYQEIAGRKCYAALGQIDAPCDIAVIALPAAQVPEVIAQCGARGIGFAVVLGGGFRETGPAGARIEAAMLANAREHGVRIVGPNCLGVVSVQARVFAAFGSITRPPLLTPGAVSAVLQSGGLGNSLVIRCALAGVGFRHVVSIGNEADIDTPELIEAFVADAETRVILTYIEGVNDGRALMRALRRACVAGKPVIVLKAGNTEPGKAAASSHTANLTGRYDIYRAALRQCAAVEVEDLDQAADFALALLPGRMPKGRNVAAMGASGGAAAVFSDAADACGLELVPLAETTTAVLREVLPPIASLKNPVDYTSGYPRPDTREAFQRAFDAVLADPGVHQLALLFATPNQRQLMIASELLANCVRACDKPLFVFSVIPADITPEGSATLARAVIPVLPSPRRIARAMAMLADYADRRERARAPLDPGPVARPELPPPSGRPIRLDEHAAKRLLAQAGIPVTRDTVLPADEVSGGLDALRFPIALKVLSPDIAHKTDIGAVRLGVADAAQLRHAAKEILGRVRTARPDARITGLLACEMVEDGLEIIVGVVNDAGFGPVVALGLGGVLAETVDDVTYRVAPFGAADAVRMLTELRAHRVFDGVRGREPRDVDALVAVLVHVSELAWSLRDRVVEMDINPLMVMAKGKGVVAADALVVLR
ncbi:MAG: acetate--CoA ligase family protein [Burkholderiales bacterium]|nr:acetate--CoA ligase family protein [Burkholderiales bacterium]